MLQLKCCGQKISNPGMEKAFLNPILHTWIGDSCFACDVSLTIQVSPLLFKIGMIMYLTIQEISFKWVNVMLSYKEGGRAACSGGWGQCDDSYYWLCIN
jgi:hypothetical protein